MSNSTNKQKRSKKLIKFATGSALMGAIIGMGGLGSQATAGNYSVMGSGSEVREALSTINSLQKPAELACGATEHKTDKDTKATEAKCGAKDKKEAVKKAATKEAKAVQKTTLKKSESKMSEGKCGEGKCGGDMKKEAAKKAATKEAKAVKKSAVKKTDSKTTEAKCGEGKCGS